MIEIDNKPVGQMEPSFLMNYLLANGRVNLLIERDTVIEETFIGIMAFIIKFIFTYATILSDFNHINRGLHCNILFTLTL